MGRNLRPCGPNYPVVAPTALANIWVPNIPRIAVIPYTSNVHQNGMDTYLSICLAACPPIYLSVCISIHLPVCLSICLSFYPYIYLPAYPRIYVYVRVSVY